MWFSKKFKFYNIKEHSILKKSEKKTLDNFSKIKIYPKFKE